MAAIIVVVILKSLFTLVSLESSTLWKCVKLITGTRMNSEIHTKIVQKVSPELQQQHNMKRLELQFKLFVVAFISRKKVWMT